MCYMRSEKAEINLEAYDEEKIFSIFPEDFSLIIEALKMEVLKER